MKKKKIKILKLIGHEYQGSHSDGSGKDNLSLNYGFKKNHIYYRKYL